MATEVEFVSPEGIMHALYEEFPLGGGAETANVKCLVLQNEAGGSGRRIKADSHEADRLRQLYPVLKGLDA